MKCNNNVKASDVDVIRLKLVAEILIIKIAMSHTASLRVKQNGVLDKMAYLQDYPCK
jgi:hypothetical protein